jgi:hypothetical protein
MSELFKALVRKFEDWLFPLRLALGKKYMYDENRVIVRIWPRRLIKGPVRESEYEAQSFVTIHTTVPAPRVYRTYRRSNGLFIEMEFVDGERLDSIWSDLRDSEKRAFVKHIWAQIAVLRSDTPPARLSSLAVGSISGGSVRDGALSEGTVGPYYSLGEFRDVLRPKSDMLEFPPNWQDEKEVVLTHADLSPRNVIVRPNRSICIIDWEFAGWWPAYWEYVKWHFADFPTLEGWVDLMDKTWSSPE